MQALSKTAAKPALGVKDSYLGIWNYFQGQRQPISSCRQACRRKPQKSSLTCFGARASSQLSTSRPSNVPSTDVFSSDAVTTQSTEESEAYGLVQFEEVGFITEEELSLAATTQKEGPRAASSGLTQNILDKLQVYQEQRSGPQQPSKKLRDWYWLREIARGSALDDGKFSEEIELHGFITSQRGNKSKSISFYELVDPHLRTALQLIASGHQGQDISESKTNPDVPRDSVQRDAAPGTPTKANKTRFDGLDLRPHTPVRVRGRLACRANMGSGADFSIAPHWLHGVSDGNHNEFGKHDGVAVRLDPYVGEIYSLRQIEMHISDIVPLNAFPEALVAKADTNFPPEQRHLQLRTSAQLRESLRTRSLVAARSRKFLFKQGFDEIETPLLFKSTPEGAREFIVPTRTPGMAYALPQSPQQYKQLLMASGISRYFQFAKCFRDEDMRTDRQPEFTQLDLEMSFAGRGDVMSIIEYLVAGVIWPDAKHRTPFRDRQESFAPFHKWIPTNTTNVFPILSYQRAMQLYGSDKPDLRFEYQFRRVDTIVPAKLRAMLTSLEDPALEMFKLPLSCNSDPKRSSIFIGEFLDAPASAVYLNNPAGAPGVAVYDPTKPLEGLAAFGHDAAEQVREMFHPEPGDVLIFQARPKTKSFTGGSTPLGNLRRDLFTAALAQGLQEKPNHDAFIWVTNFPLFSPVQEAEPGQGGSAGICSTHHPFTAPATGQDLTKLYTDPLSIIGDHYDLVINGVEVGGGSVRIHDAAIQELIFRDVLKMHTERIEDFRHLLDALAAGCPPHAGFALGFDRLMAVLLEKESVKDVIAFPKTAAGEDKMVSSPAKMTQAQLDTYHLAIKEGGLAPKPEPLSLKA